jgi:hypothetical protein
MKNLFVNPEPGLIRAGWRILLFVIIFGAITAAGIVISAMIMATMFFMLLGIGVIEFHRFSWWGDNVGLEAVFTAAAVPVALAVFYKLAIVAWWEELVFRGYFLQNLIAGVGLHLGWNFFQASVFGFPASGQVSPSMISQSPVGPEWLSGGKFGAEGSVLILPVTLLSYLLIHYWVCATRQSGQGLIEPMARDAAA